MLVIYWYFPALFEAVEHQDMDRAKEILENNTINVNG